MNPWEDRALQVSSGGRSLMSALQYYFPTPTEPSPVDVSNSPRTVPAEDDKVHDRIIYPGIYSASGFDVMGVLWRLAQRPNPVVDIGYVDASCAFVVCDMHQPDCPIIYASDPFTHLTGYSKREILGQNCRFLQAPGGSVVRASPRQYVDKAMVNYMRHAVEHFAEISVELINFRKNGQPFVNILTLIPVSFGGPTPEYFVGFSVEKEQGW
ncbi:vivid PAS protein VVD [Microdochium trichocladiopsis]|uniref:Vivid PAS protein VVD n=1 Tax=Microdochium trichocladiopsis TaxID=1682393 RepID=A0A9P8YIV5_9PEZI|nr:vivid PAS protein VVD [Microdochium trichocladiopsis]KAH7040807.1 vivid PAS protein VVD [Microdochium trichocladiopsis]